MDICASQNFAQVTMANGTFVYNLQQLMRKKNVSEAELSRHTHIPQPTLHKILTGKTADPRISTLKNLADYFKVTIDDLYSREIFYHEKPIPHGQFISILSWKGCVSGRKQESTPSVKAKLCWISSNKDDAKDIFVLVSKPSMEPKFTQGTMLIISRIIQPKDGDFVVVHYSGTEEATLRQLYIDGPERKLLPINDNIIANRDVMDEKKIIIGTLIQARFDYNMDYEDIIT